MNWQQVLSALRNGLSAGGPISALLIAIGYTHTEDLSKAVEALIVLLAAATPVISIVWGWFTHTKSNALATVAMMPGDEKRIAFLGVPDSLKVEAAAAIPGVESIKVTPTAPAALAAVAADPAQPKVTR